MRNMKIENHFIICTKQLPPQFTKHIYEIQSVANVHDFYSRFKCLVCTLLAAYNNGWSPSCRETKKHKQNLSHLFQYKFSAQNKKAKIYEENKKKKKMNKQKHFQACTCILN